MAESDVERASELDLRYRELLALERQTFSELGDILLEIRNRELWRYMERLQEPPYHSFDDFVTRASGTSARTAYDALACAEGLSDVPNRQEIPRCNQKILNQLSPVLKKDPEIQQAAQTMKEREFENMIAENYPLQHCEVRLPIYLRRLTAMERKEILAAAEIAKVTDDAETIEEQVLAMARHFVECKDNRHLYRATLEQRRQAEVIIQ